MAGRGNLAPAIGIDLGTTYSCVAVWMDDKVEIIANDQGNRTTPSAVSFDDFERIIGDGAKNQAPTNPANTVFDVKRFIGRRFSDSTLQNDMKMWPFKVIERPDNKPMIVVTFKGQEKEFSAEEISAMVLGKMKETAEAYLENDVKDVVLTVPAYFNDSQRQATMDAGIIAGLNVISMINEPTAAAIAYELDKNLPIDSKKNVLVFDLGGGTLDVCLLTIEEGPTFKVKAIDGDTHLGGEDFVNRMVEHCVKEFKKKNNKDLSGNKRAMGRLKDECERAKRMLSTRFDTSVDFYGLHEGIDFSLKFTRAKFENLNMELFSKCIKSVEACLSHAMMKKSCVDKVVLVGGSTRIPKVQEMLEEYFTGITLSKSINPDEAIAYGAAVKAAKVRGSTDNRIRDLVLCDVTPLSLGVEMLPMLQFSIVIPRNTPIPTTQYQTFSTTYDNQTTITFKVYQGERAKAADNHFLGSFTISGIPPAPKKVPDILGYFEIDANGMLTVTAAIKSTGKKEKLIISKENGRLCKEEIEKMITDAEKYKIEDQEFKKKVEEYNALELCVYNMKTKIEQHSIKKSLHHEILQVMEKAIDETSQWLDYNQAPTFADLHLKKKHLEFVCKPLSLPVE